MDQSTQGSFQKIFMIAGFVFGVLGIFVFSISTFGGNVEDPNLTGTAIIWGTLPAEQMNPILYEYSQNMKTYSVQYVEKRQDKIVTEFIEELSVGRGPDLLFVSEDISTPLASQYLAYFGENLMPEKVFKEVYARSTYKLYSPKGVFSFPIGIDPLIMYVNTDILTNASYSKAPTTWGEIPLYVSRVLGFAKADENSVQRAIAMGSLNNIVNYREVLLTLLMQLKNDVIQFSVEPEVKRDPATKEDITVFNEKYESVLGLTNEETKIKNDILAEQVFVFFTSFVNPSIKEAYTWSKKAPIDRDLFAAGNLGLYFGLASDRQYISARNPHLKYEINLVPGPKGATANFRNVNYAKIYGLSISGKTRNIILAKKVLEDLSSKEYSGKIVAAYDLAPARQDELYATILDENGKPVLTQNVDQKLLNKDVIYKAADRGDIVLEPRPNLVKNIFEQIVDAFAGSRQTPTEIIKNADQELIRILK